MLGQLFFGIESKAMKLYILRMAEFEKSKYGTALSKRKKHHAAGQYLLRQALGVDAYEKANFAKNEHGKPYIVGTPSHYNISHSGEYVVLVTAKTEVGADVQEKKPARMESMVKRFFAEEEVKAFFECGSEEEKKNLFYHVWCRKEAYGKYLGTGLNTEVLQTNVLSHVEDVQWIEYEAVEGYQISICCGKEESIEEVISVFEGL